jgi:hypothetical protein
MRAFLTVLAAGIALGACKKEPEPAPPRLSAQTMTQPPQVTGPSPGARGREKAPAWDLAKKIPGREPLQLKPSQGRLLERLRTGKLSVVAGKGTLSAVIGTQAVSVPLEVFRRGPALVLSGERPDLGIVLTIPVASPGTYVRGPEASSAQGEPRAARPQLRIRQGAGPKASVLLSHDGAGEPGLTIELVEASSTIRGTFRGRVSSGNASEVKVVREGKFSWTADASRRSSDGP